VNNEVETPKSPDKQIGMVSEFQGIYDRNPDFDRIFFLGLFSQEVRHLIKPTKIIITKEAFKSSKEYLEEYH
jgi:hypothetical protein